jgi:hypothetical protein
MMDNQITIWFMFRIELTMTKYLETAEVSKMLKAAILCIAPDANVSVRMANTFFTRKFQEVKQIDVYIKNFDRMPVETINRIALACRTHEGTDHLYGTRLRRWILSGEIAYMNGVKGLKVPWRKSQQEQLLMYEPEEITLGCEKVNLYIGRGTTGPFTDQVDFTWIKENFAICDDGYAMRLSLA